MKRLLKIMAGILIVGLLVWLVTRVASSPEQSVTSSPQASEVAQDLSNGYIEPEELIERVKAFEVALNTRQSGDTTAVVYSRIKPYASDEYMDWVGIDLTSKPERIFAATNDRLEIRVDKVDLGEADDHPDLAYDVYAQVQTVRYNKQNEVVERKSDTSVTSWAYSPQTGWRVYPTE